MLLYFFMRVLIAYYKTEATKEFCCLSIEAMTFVIYRIIIIFY